MGLMKALRALPGGQLADQFYRNSAYVLIRTAPLLKSHGKRIMNINGYYYYWQPPTPFSVYHAHPLYGISPSQNTVEQLKVNDSNTALLKSPKSVFVESTYVVHPRGPTEMAEAKQPTVNGGVIQLQELTNRQHTADRNRYQLVASRTGGKPRLQHTKNRVNATLLTLQGIPI